MDLKKMEKGVALILDGMGVDRKDSNFLDTPTRVAKMYQQMLTPQVNNWTTFPSPSKGMIVLRGHRVFALCPHHLMPVELRAYVAYIPKERVLGLSKLCRVVEEHLREPIMQEDLARRVADTLFKHKELSPEGVAIVLAGQHGCMRYRGVETDGDVVASEMRGLFLHSPSTREEFLSFIGKP